ncbi:PLP-dependent aminotransferase family protein [Streptacidiphilus sp. ASG 303]|uniref:MocR-like pyridoxine biosynthesis transcription factor PdxR n=1 Tax=Streptacidiphilus sp. ASG 303 TaxID=2896847 RepID=UPI001E542310|nr:PLP-dependent aminotransferase family protein [Streptacidiphilus sp. ASG 303]MCD0481884.1 PLP-dependent aminotransferase family protein [Streptacidiphilus sp. ASG 303]
MGPRAIPGSDLHLDLAPGPGVRAALERALRDAVRGGRLAPGSRLPSSRTLARDLGLARNTVADAYGQLVAEGWLTARQGSGTRVAERPDGAPRAGRAPRRRSAPDDPFAAPGDASLPYDLRPGSPDLSLFPRTAWLAATRRALDAAPNRVLGYTDPQGLPELRRALAGYLARTRGVRTDPELVVVCTGFVQAAGVLGRALHRLGGRRVAVEALGFHDTRRVLEAAGLAVDRLPVDAGGARTDLLAAGPAAALLTPSHQFPAGVPLRPDRRTAAVTWARRTGAVLVEDDYDGEFRYDRQPVGALQGLDPEHVVYAGTASKSLAPGLRLAWLAVPPRLLDAVVAEKRLSDHHSPVLEQLALAELIDSGGYDRQVRRARLHYRRRRDRLAAAVAQHAPDVAVTGIAAGLHAVLELPPRLAGEGPAHADGKALTARAARRGLALHTLGRYRDPADREPYPPALVVGYGTPPDHAFTGALDLLCGLLADRARLSA